MFLKIKQKLEQPLFCIRLFSALTCLYGFTKISLILIYIMGLVAAAKFDYTESTKSFGLYLDIARETSGIDSEGYVLYIFTFSALFWTSFIVSGVFLFLRKHWARKMLLSLIVISFLNYFMMMLWEREFFIKIENVIVFIILFAIFTYKPIVQLFAKDA